MRKCKIIGYKCLIQGSPLRLSFNYAQYANSHVPAFQPGGGGWSLMVFSLDSLFDDYEKLQNVWTFSNSHLPLVRYHGVTFKFYQTEDMDYVVYFDRCWPMVDTKHTHANCSPTAQFLKQKKITIPSRKTQKNKKPYKKVRIRPPNQMQTKWYFQSDICKTPLVLLATTAVSLTNPFCAPEATSNNITIPMLNTMLIQRPNFKNYPVTTGYFIKTGQFEHEDSPFAAYLYAIHRQQDNETQSIELKKSNLNKYNPIPLCNTKVMQPGVSVTSTNYENNEKYWGNPFFHTYLDDEIYSLYFSNMTPTDLFQLKNTNDKTYHLTLTDPIIKYYRYNPETDKGATNKVYTVSNSTATSWAEPQNENLIFEGFPLYVLLWGWPDWLKKAKLTVDPDENQTLVIKTDQLFGPKQTYYVPIDKDFIEGFAPYSPEPPNQILPNNWSKLHWHPKLEFQLQQIEKICSSGPGCARMPYKHYMQSFCKYKFHFTWGGCPKTLENACNPCFQPKWPTTDTIPGGLEISNPNCNPYTQLYDFDWKGDFVKTKSIDRIKQHTSVNPDLFSITEGKNIPETLKKAKTPTTKEEEKELLLQLQQLRECQLNLYNILNQ